MFLWKLWKKTAYILLVMVVPSLLYGSICWTLPKTKYKWQIYFLTAAAAYGLPDYKVSVYIWKELQEVDVNTRIRVYQDGWDIWEGWKVSISQNYWVSSQVKMRPRMSKDAVERSYAIIITFYKCLLFCTFLLEMCEPLIAQLV